MIYLGDLLDATGAAAPPEGLPERFAGFAFDSRRVREGDLFVAIRTDRGDGHDFTGEALRAGAAAVLCEKPPPGGGPCILVDDPLEAVRRYAALALRRFAPRIVGITGSAGKTSVREFAAHVLADRFEVFRNPENYNDLVGLPLALGELDPGHAVAVLEMASDAYGEMAGLAELAPASICVLTRFDETYMEYFGSMDAIAAEHGALVRALPPDGLLIYPADDPAAVGLAGGFAGRKISYGLTEGVDVRAAGLEMAADGTRFALEMDGASTAVSLPLPGAHNVENALAAAALAGGLGMDVSAIAGRLGTLEPVVGRFRQLASSEHGILYDDTFANGPASLQAALDHFRDVGSRPLAVLGGAPHLGAAAETVAARLGPAIAGTVGELICFGDAGQGFDEAARAAGLAAEQVHQADTIEQARALVAELADADTPILVKGSSRDRLERLTGLLMAEPEAAPELLCRQSAAWRQIATVNPDAPLWVQVDLDAIAANARRIQEIVGPEVALLAVLKAEAYGHGALKVATAAMRAGAGGVAVARLDEARSLRRAGFDAPVLVLGATAPAESRQAVLSGCALTVFDERGIDALVRAAAAQRQIVPVHLKIETGMGRLGAAADAAVGLAERIVAAEELHMQGTFTHLGRSDRSDKTDANEQLDHFEAALAEIHAAGIAPGLVHAANSAAALTMPRARYDAVRCGIALLGIDPAETCPLPDGFSPALTMKARVAQVKDVAAGGFVGYGDAGRLERDTRIAVVAAGYGDGLRHGPNNAGQVVIRGQPAMIVGNICMDMFMIDVTAIPGARPGDEVTLIGGGTDSPVAVDAVARATGTLPYEVISQLLPRVPRV
ncbi:MAG: alanine racemase [Chloroflexota bacterium]|nr:alanine racemase [Chloroflexota bacterium]